VRQVRDKLSETHQAINTIRRVKRQVEEWNERSGGQSSHDDLVAAGKTLVEKLQPIEEQLTQVKAKVREDTLNYPMMLNAKLGALMGVAASADSRPTRQMVEVYQSLAGQVDAQLAQLRSVVDEDLARYNRLIQEAGVPAVAA
ncbi:MAG TPA: hypothetical protein VMU89_06050, partial [Thermomicrobiaceae bacterium]|nr:hypothetical protein [Thermomicrobiaceae bacterium]